MVANTGLLTGARPHFLGNAIVLACVGLLSTGCWDRREINQLGIVASAAVDVLGAKPSSAGQQESSEPVLFHVTAELFRPRAMGAREAGAMTSASTRQVSVGTGTGYTVSAAIEELDLKMARHPYWAHAVCVILGEDLLKMGVLETIDLWDRDPEIRRSMHVLMAHGLAERIVTRAQGLLERTLGEEILGLSLIVRRDGHNYIPSVHEIIVDLTGETKSGFLPIISLGPEPEPSQPGPVPEGQRPRVWTPVVMPTARLEGAGLLYRGRLVGELSPRETRGLMWARNKASGGIVNVTCPECGERVALEVSKIRAQVAVKSHEEQLLGSISVLMEVNLAEQGCEHNLTTTSAIASLERRSAEAVRNEIAEAVAKTQRYGTDVMGFGSVLHRTNPKLWRRLRDRWRDEYRSLPVKIQVRASLRRTGLTLQPPPIR